MDGAVSKIECPQVFQDFAYVVEIEGGDILVRTAAADYRARRAVTCLVQPKVGDRVLVATEDGGDSFVLSILSRPEQSTTVLSVEGDLSVRATGRVAMVAQDGIDIATTGTTKLTSNALVAQAHDVRVAGQQLELFGAELSVESGNARASLAKADFQSERVRSHVGQSYRTIDEIDQVRANHIDYKASGNTHVRGENTLVTAHGLVKLNASQVHIS